MGIPRWTGPLLFLAGGAVLALAASRGEATLSLVLILPVIAAKGPLGALAIGLLVAAFLLTFIAWPFRLPDGPGESPSARAPAVPPESPAAARRWGGVLFLGPIPVVFGSDARVTRGMLLLGFILFLALLGLTLFLVLGGA